MFRRYPEAAEFKRLILLQDKYIGILAGELSDMIEEGFACGWVSKRTNEIAGLREDIRQGKKAMKLTTARAVKEANAER